MANITQKEWLDFLHLLHNKLRNSEGMKLTGMTALTEINNFMLFRFLDDSEKFGLIIPDNMKFKHLYLGHATDEKIAEDKNNRVPGNRHCAELCRKIYRLDDENKCLLQLYFENNVLSKYIESTVNRISVYINRTDSCVTIQDIMNTIYKKFKDTTFDTNFFDMFGSAYEEFKTNACSNSGKHTGQHFTNVFIKKIIINEIKPKHNEIFYEPCAGSGGFVHTADHYVFQHEGINKSKIFKQNVYANECNPEIFRPLIMNMLFHNIPVNKIRERDSLSDGNIVEMLNKVNVIATNYPFGMNNTLKNLSVFEEKYWLQLKSGKNYVKNSSAQFIIHIYNSLVNGGRTGFVSDRGILNNGVDKATSWESKLRKFLFENNNVYKIVYLPQGAFTYTNFQTCMIFMVKGRTTQEVKLYEAKFRNPKDKTSEIYVEDKPVKVFKIKDLRGNNYSVKLEVVVEEVKEGWVKLGEAIKFERGKPLTTDKMIDGEYKVIGGGFKFMEKTHNEYNCDENITIMSNDGAYAGFLNRFKEKIFITSHCNKMKIINEDIYEHDFIYYFLKITYQNKLITRNEDGFQIGQAQPSININKMYTNILVPALSLVHQQEIIEFLDKQFETHNIELLSQYTKNIDLFKLLIHKKYDECADALYIIYRKIEADDLYNKYNLDKKAIFNININSLGIIKYKLEDIVTITKGTFNTKDIDGKGEYPYYNSGFNNPCNVHSQYSCDFEECIIFIKDGGDKNNPFNENSGMCKPFYVRGKIAVMSHLLIFTNTNKNLYDLKYLYFYLEYNRKKLMKSAKYNSGLGHIGIDTIKNFEIPIPSLEDQKIIIAKIQKIKDEQSQFSDYVKELENNINLISVMIEKLNTSKKNNNKEEKENEEIERVMNVNDELKKEEQPIKSNFITIKKPNVTQNKNASNNNIKNYSDSEQDEFESDNEDLVTFNDSDEDFENIPLKESNNNKTIKKDEKITQTNKTKLSVKNQVQKNDKSLDSECIPNKKEKSLVQSKSEAQYNFKEGLDNIRTKVKQIQQTSIIINKSNKKLENKSTQTTIKNKPITQNNIKNVIVKK